MMCDGLWEDVQGELEGAAASCESYLPANCWQGLINLFGYYEAVPECEWSSARSSLGSLAVALEGVEKDLFASIRFARKVNTSQQMSAVSTTYYYCIHLNRCSDKIQCISLWSVRRSLSNRLSNMRIATSRVTHAFHVHRRLQPSLGEEALSVRFADQDYIAETKLYYDTVLGKLRRAGDLFQPGNWVQMVLAKFERMMPSQLTFLLIRLAKW